MFSRFYTHTNLFAFRFIGGLETLASEFAAGTIFAAVIVCGSNKSVFLFGTGTRKEDLSPACTKKTILVLQRLHILDPPELRLEFLCLLLFVGDRLNKAVLTVPFQIQIIADAFVSGICHNVTVAFALHPLDMVQERNERTGMRMCNDGWLQGWHERNGGNLTYRMKEEEVAECRPFFDEQPREWVNMGVQADNLAGEYFITTGSGKFFRNVESDPVHSIGIVEINDKGDSWRIVWGLEDGAKPTSEFPSHFMNHSVRKAATNGANRVIYHCHATNVIALTYILPLTDRDFTRALWQSATECPVVFPEGVGVCPWMVPGGADIAMATSELMKHYQAAIWAQHGLFASGPDFDITFGLAHTIEKSAEIYVKVLSMGGGIIRQTITDDDLRAIARDFGVTLNEKFLN